MTPRSTAFFEDQETLPAPLEPPIFSTAGEAEDRRPEQLISRYILNAIQRATFEEVEGKWYAEVVILPGVWAEGDSLSEAEESLAEVIRGWIDLKIDDQDRDFPILGQINLNLL
jgi:predicted RNase H-like HicB family nuclease